MLVRALEQFWMGFGGKLASSPAMVESLAIRDLAFLFDGQSLSGNY